MNTMSKETNWNETVDVVVLGSGGAALTAATTAHDNGAKVLLLDKYSEIGGTTAMSGGVPWIPSNHYMKEEGISDSKEKALTYIHQLLNGKEPNPDLIEIYLDKGKEMIQYLHDHTPVK